jgi:hypothetical protein
MELLTARRQALEKRQGELADMKETSPSVKLSIEEHCTEVRRRLAKLTFETKRNVLRLLVRRIIFEGNQVRICGVVPLAQQGAIATTGVDSCGHNAAMQATFSLAAGVHWDPAAARAASRANLVKANKALRALRQAEIKR